MNYKRKKPLNQSQEVQQVQTKTSKKVSTKTKQKPITPLKPKIDLPKKPEVSRKLASIFWEGAGLKTNDKSLAEFHEKAKEEFVKVLELNYGMLSTTYKMTGVPKGTYYKWYRDDLVFREKVIEAKELAIDVVETQLYKNIKSGKEISTIFYLKTRAKHRGYIEQQHMDITSGGEKLVFKFGEKEEPKPVWLEGKITDVEPDDNTINQLTQGTTTD